jgi:hypothetical protein
MDADELARISEQARIAARRTISRLAASEQALLRHAELSAKGQLGQNMAVPPIEKRHAPKPAGAVKAVDLEAAGPAELWDAIDRVQISRELMQRQAAPLAQREPEPETRVNLPTSERRAQIDTELTTYTTTVQAGRKLASEAWRVTPIVEHMRNRGQLGDLEMRAAEDFYRDFVLGHRVRGLVSSYGQSPGGGGEGFGGDEIRQKFHDRFIRACRAIGHMPTIEWMVRIICEQIMAGEAKPPTLADAGKAYMHYKDQKQQQAVGATLIKSGLERLVRHYGLDVPEAWR